MPIRPENRTIAISRSGSRSRKRNGNRNEKDIHRGRCGGFKLLAETEGAKPFRDLAETPSVEIRIKRDHGAPMHLKSYEIDGRLLRTGAANFSASGLKRQDNYLVIIENAAAAAAFKRNFEAQFAGGTALQLGAIP